MPENSPKASKTVARTVHMGWSSQFDPSWYLGRNFSRPFESHG
jgi:hypothetical protein